MTRYEINTSDDVNIIAGREMDKQTKATMKILGLQHFRSTKDRKKDRLKAITKNRKKVDLKEFAIHHRFDGLVGLVPRELHESIHHYGYFYRLGH